MRGINRAFAVTTDQSCLNRLLTEASWDPQALNERRLDWLQHDSTTRYRQDGVIAIDTTLIDHEGKPIADVGYFWDHADKRHLIAHDDMIITYVQVSGKRYPLTFQRFRKRAVAGAQFKTHTQQCCDLIDWAGERQIPGDFTFDGSFTNAAIMDHIHAHDRAYGGGLKTNCIVTVDGRDRNRSEWVARELGPLARTKRPVDDQTQW